MPILLHFLWRERRKKNYHGKGMEGEQKVSLRRFGADQKIASL